MSKVLKSISSKLKKASKAHASQANKIDKVLKSAPFKMKGFSGFGNVKTDKNQSSFIPAYPGADISKAEYDKIMAKKQMDKPVKPKQGDYKKYSDLEKYDDDKPVSKKSPAKGKISASCKAYAKRRFKVWPSAYASGFAVKSQKAGKC